MELAPRIHKGHSKGRTVPGSGTNCTHSLGRRLRRNCISFKTAFFPPVEREVHTWAWQGIQANMSLNTYFVLCIVLYTVTKRKTIGKIWMRREVKCPEGHYINCQFIPAWKERSNSSIIRQKHLNLMKQRRDQRGDGIFLCDRNRGLWVQLCLGMFQGQICYCRG